ncbi:MAG: methionyl-tRNA formyltransferase [Planctomycetes bacterium]|nr:methionyl-tRNA formyltransferase [Planctomycetota bacterium]
MSTRLRVVFLGSPPFGTPVLSALLEAEHELVGVVTRPDRPRGRGRSVERGEVALLADERGVSVLQPESTRGGDFAASLHELSPDVLVVASYGEILDEEVLSVPTLAPLNVHASLLPRHRGSSPIQAAILAGDSTTGVSVQRMVLALDAGDVLLERELSIGVEETAGELHDRLAPLAGEAAVAALDVLAEGDAVFAPQDEARVTMTRRLRKGDGRPDLKSLDAEGFVRHVRAMTPWPGARVELCRDGEDPLALTLHSARVAEGGGWSGGAPGDLRVEGERLLLALAQGVVDLVKVQPAGKRPMDVADFLRGARVEGAARLRSEPCRD